MKPVSTLLAALLVLPVVAQIRTDCSFDDIIHAGNGRGHGVGTQAFAFPAKIKVDPSRGWMLGESMTFLNPGSGFEATADPGVLRLAPIAKQTLISDSFVSDKGNITATGRFTATFDGTQGHSASGSVRIDTLGAGTGVLNLVSQQFSVSQYGELSLWFKADAEFGGFTLMARVKQGAITITQTLLDIRDGRAEDGSPLFNGQWQHLRIHLGELLAYYGKSGATLTSVYIQNSVTAVGPKMWIDDLELFGATYPNAADYVSPPYRMDETKPFDTFYWATERWFFNPYASPSRGTTGTDIQFQIRTADSRAGLSSATWYGPTSDSDWYQGDTKVAHYAKINSVHNGDRWMQVRVRFTSNSDHTKTPILEDFTVTWGSVNQWNTMGLLFKAVDADYLDSNSAPQHETFTMSQGSVDYMTDQWGFFTSYAPRLMSYNMTINQEWHVIEGPVTGSHLSGGPGSYTIDPNGALPLYQQYLTGKTWDSVMMHFQWKQLPFPAWGLAWWPPLIPGGAAMNQIIYLDWTNYPHQEVMLHEWMHSLAWIVVDRTDQLVPHPHSDQDAHWDGTGLTSMDYYYHSLVWHGTRPAYEGAAVIDAEIAPYLRDWISVGRFSYNTTNDDGLFTDYIGEATANPWFGTSMGGKTWVGFTSASDLMNLGTKYGTVAGSVAYANVYYHSDKEQTVKLWTGSDDGFRAWNNGQLVRSRHQHRGAVKNSDCTAIYAEPGWNVLTLKVENQGGAWGYYVRLTDNNGQSVSGIDPSSYPLGFSGFENVTGKVNLVQFVDPTKARLRFRVVDSSTGEVVLSRWVSPASDGSFALAPVPHGSWLLEIDGSHWLRKVIPIAVGASDLALPDIVLVNGDVNEDNSIDIFDLNTLLGDFGAYNIPSSDLEGSGQVDVNDLVVVFVNFSQTGD